MIESPLTTYGALPLGLTGRYLRLSPPLTPGHAPYLAGLRLHSGAAWRARACALPEPELAGGPSMLATERAVVVVESPLRYSRAADLVGLREPYDPRETVRVGVRTVHGEERWFAAPGYAAVVRAFDDEHRVALDFVGPDAGLRRVTLCPVTGAVRVAELADGVSEAAAIGDGVYLLRGGVLRDLGGTVAEADPRWRLGGLAGDGSWLMALGEDPAARESALLVWNAEDLGEPVAEVRVPGLMPWASRATWAAGRS